MFREIQKPTWTANPNSELYKHYGRDKMQVEITRALAVFVSGVLTHEWDIDADNTMQGMVKAFKTAARKAEDARYTWERAHNENGGAPDEWANAETMTDEEYNAVFEEWEQYSDAEDLYNNAYDEMQSVIAERVYELRKSLEYIGILFADHVEKYHLDGIDSII